MSFRPRDGTDAPLSFTLNRVTCLILLTALIWGRSPPKLHHHALWNVCFQLEVVGKLQGVETRQPFLDHRYLDEINTTHMGVKNSPHSTRMYADCPRYVHTVHRLTLRWLEMIRGLVEGEEAPSIPGHRAALSLDDTQN